MQSNGEVSWNKQLSERFRFVAFTLGTIAIAVIPLYSQTSPQQPAHEAAPVIQTVAPPLIQTVAPPSPTASVAELEDQGDDLREEKLYLDALDYYHAAIAKEPENAPLYNKAGMAELLLQHYREAEGDFKRAIQLDHHFADARNNLGVVEYERGKYGGAIKEYRRAIKIKPNSASFYNNLGAAYFSKKKWKEATEAYSTAIQLDPDIFNRTSRIGVTAQMSSPEDQARFEYVLAKIYAKDGRTDHALMCLRRALEGGYKDIDDAFKDSEFSALRKDPRFIQLMAERQTPIPN
jgi:tetratricopeptide (TPR) repeat protein